MSQANHPFIRVIACWSIQGLKVGGSTPIMECLGDWEADCNSLWVKALYKCSLSIWARCQCQLSEAGALWTHWRFLLRRRTAGGCFPFPGCSMMYYCLILLGHWWGIIWSLLGFALESADSSDLSCSVPQTMERGTSDRECRCVHGRC